MGMLFFKLLLTQAVRSQTGQDNEDRGKRSYLKVKPSERNPEDFDPVEKRLNGKYIALTRGRQTRRNDSMPTGDDHAQKSGEPDAATTPEVTTNPGSQQ